MSHHHYIAGLISALALISAVSSPKVRSAIVFYVDQIAKSIIQLAKELRQDVRQHPPKVSVVIKGGKYAYTKIS